MQETNDTTLFTSVKTEFQKIRSLPKGKRWEYIWEYYRLTFFLVIFALFFTGALITFLVNSVTHTLFPKDPVSIAIASPGFSGNEDWLNACREAIGYDEKTEDLRMMATSPYNTTTDDFRITTTVWFTNGQPDIFLLDENSYRYLQELGILINLSETWPEHLRQLAADRMVDPFVVDISGSGVAQAYGLSEEPVYLCMVVNGSGYERALDIVEYILTEN